MVADWNQYISISEFLLTHIDESAANEEMICRCVISRVYYAAYCTVRNAAETCGIFSSTGDSKDHAELRNVLRRYRHIKIASDLNDLRKYRNDADYKNESIFNHEDAESAIKIAKKVCSESVLIERASSSDIRK